MEIISADLHLDVLIFFKNLFTWVIKKLLCSGMLVVTAGKFAWDDILRSMPVGHLLGSNLSECERSCAFCLNRNVADFTIQECFIRGTKELFHHHFAKIILYNAKPLSVWVCCPNPIYYDFSIIVQFLLSFCNHSSLSQSKNNLKNMKVTFLKFNSTIQGLNLILQQPSLSLTYAVVFVFVRRFICWF